MDLQHIGIIVSIVVGILSILKALKPIKDKLNSLLKLQELQSDSLRDLIRFNLIDLTNTILEREEITKEEIFVIRKLYQDYKNLDGNSTIDERVRMVMCLKTVKGQFQPKSN